jgi:hypothetical protein
MRDYTPALDLARRERLYIWLLERKWGKLAKFVGPRKVESLSLKQELTRLAVTYDRPMYTWNWTGKTRPVKPHVPNADRVREEQIGFGL